ncbi:hypothetical protein HMPREF0497_2057 [Lentilactobacillus buchneri ATCC 11577]|uniref:Uncharacterized protein n=1 Tax=Lentilactobacillus hilgardii (strain ATCC 8290 / DSM 20176 / CCUG 30140 / JCM 1155 / KCTC 3500 / NBRC 15886 / NCIMB 8040 / NRRL B-1843 / 9) TaxID=1423757 RepID=C0XHR1_LENH9|nr:hypothetical protein HMPREF0497_2057 [Lentilactobacillus buchneri ATCC 11577]EEI25193.1 hypothetical protein HMPREF0519_0772 [Lentilactobacillus hilgardii DSM 20176 = ATCC 8290]
MQICFFDDIVLELNGFKVKSPIPQMRYRTFLNDIKIANYLIK